MIEQAFFSSVFFTHCECEGVKLIFLEIEQCLNSQYINLHDAFAD